MIASADDAPAKQISATRSMRPAMRHHTARLRYTRGTSFGRGDDMGQAVSTAVGAAILLGAVMTFGDFVWTYFDVRHRVWTGAVHGAAMCFFIGGVIGARTGRIAAGLIGGPIIGVGAAGVFYVLAPTLGWGAMLPAWMLFWICFAVLQHALRPELPHALRVLVVRIPAGVSRPVQLALVPEARRAVASGGRFDLQRISHAPSLVSRTRGRARDHGSLRAGATTGHRSDRVSHAR